MTFFRKHILLSPKKFKNRYSYLFDGVNEYIQANDSPSLDITGNITISAWVKKEANGIRNIVTKWDGGVEAQKSYALLFNTNNRIQFFVSNNGSTNSSTGDFGTQITDTNWHHTVAIYDGTNLMVYLDGVEQTAARVSYSLGIFSSSATFRIGNDDDNAASILFNGNIDEVGIFNTNLTAQQITEIYNNGKPKNLLKHSAVSNLVSYFRMGDNDTWDGTNWTLIDKKGTNNGTSVNMEFADNELDTP